MNLVLITAFGVGLSTIIGGVFGFLFKGIPQKFNDAILSVAAGVMLTSAIVGLILPAIEEGGNLGLPVTFFGILSGALFLDLANRCIPNFLDNTSMKANNVGINDIKHKEKTNRVFLFIFAIIIHNFPEGIAAGVGFGTDNISNALSVSLGIAIQNIPEGMAMIAPMLSIGVSKKKTLLVLIFTGTVEIIGTMFGYFAISFASVILPFALAFAGGTMIYIIIDEMIPETHSLKCAKKLSSYSFLLGFMIMLAFDYFLS